jgi:hypothetical protein
MQRAEGSDLKLDELLKSRSCSQAFEAWRQISEDIIVLKGPGAGFGSFALSGFGDGGMLSTLETGVRVNDSLELALSGFFQRALSDSDPSADSLTAVSSMLPDPKESESGFRLAAILSPSEWFKLTPSVTKIDSAGEHSGARRSTSKILQVLDGHRPSRWPFSWGPCQQPGKPVQNPRRCHRTGRPRFAWGCIALSDSCVSPCGAHYSGRGRE